jgi:hypothetical protein
MKIRRVTRKDIEEAALLAQILGEAEMTGADFSCLTRLHDCPDCPHSTESCGHRYEWDCIADAIGASDMAIALWLSISNAFGTYKVEREEEIEDAQTPAQKRDVERYYAWVDSFGGDDGLDDELEMAALLREGELPPGWKRVRARKESST